MTRAEKLFIAFAMIAGFLIAAEFGVTRPASQSIFLSLFSTTSFPWVWLVTVPLNFVAIYLYNFFLPKIGPLRMFAAVSSVVAVIHLLCAFFLPDLPWLSFFQFAWKDIYILLMFKQFWSMVHSTVQPARAKYLYGVIFGMGALGGIAGNAIPSFFAPDFGSEKLFLFTLPVYFLLFFFYRKALSLSAIPQEEFAAHLTPNLTGFSLIRRSSFLTALLALVVCMQISVALIEYQFSAHLEANILDKDLRTAYCGQLFGLANILSGVLQFGGGFLMVHFLGVRGSHFFVPLMLLANALFSLAIQSFSVISFAFVFLKAVDYSLFGVVREMLYIPLPLDEKFRAKAVIDVFAYRTSKAVVSLFILLLQIEVGAYLLSVTHFLSVAVLIGWIGVAVWMFRKRIPLAELSR